MAVVQELSPVANITQFFEMMFGEQTGYVYAPTKELSKRPGEDRERFKRRFFSWPEEKERLVEYCLNSTSDHEVYYSPALWKSVPAKDEKLSVDHFKGTYWTWVDFDYGLPTDEQMQGLPEPTIKVQSSFSTKQHWYWRLDFWNDNKDALEAFGRRLTYKLDGDPSGWDYVQVLRPPGTVNHKGEGRKVRLLSKSSNRITVEALAAIPEPPSNTGLLISETQITDVPAITDVIMKYPWPDDAAELFRKKLSDLNIRKGRKTPDRSDALMRLGYECAEMGMTNAEIYAVLLNVDSRWKKYTNNENPAAAYIKIINRARVKCPVSIDGSVEGELVVYGFKSFLEADFHVEWVVNGLIPRAGMVVISSPPGVGKTQFSLWLAMHVALGKSVLGWTVEKPLKIVFYSMEMGKAALKLFCEQLAQNFTPEEIELLEENLKVLPLGHSILLDKPLNQAKISAQVDALLPDGVMFDSLGVAIGDDINNDTVINNTFDFLNKAIRVKHDCFVWFLHHNRKAQANNKQPKKMEDLYGSQYISSNSDVVIGLWPLATGEIEVNSLKERLSEKFKTFRLDRTTPLGFKRSGENNGVVGEAEAIRMMAGLNEESDLDDGDSSVDFGLE